MIFKGSQRRGATDLALPLYNEIDDELVTLHSIRSAVSNDLYGAFREWEIICDTGTKAKNCFYSLSINPDPHQRGLNSKEWLHSIEYIEKRLGLTGPPCAVQISHDYHKLKACSQELSKKFQLELRHGDKSKSYDHAQKVLRYDWP